MCLFSENVTHYMLKCYKSNMKEDVKVSWDWRGRNGVVS